MKIRLPFLALLGLLPLAGCATGRPQTVPSLDPVKFCGRWYEIARLPNFFQRACASDVTAEYSLLPDGRLGVINSCRRADGRVASIRGTATVVPGSGNAKLKVAFFPIIRGDYWVIALDESGYRWAVVGHPSRSFLWLLARAPQVGEADLAKMKAAAEAAGFDSSRLIFTPHKNAPGPIQPPLP